MSEVAGVVVAHGDLAFSLVRVAEQISGINEALLPISNEDCGPEELLARIETAVGDGPCVIFVDLASGSCAFASRSVGKGAAGVAVVTGVNLPLLLDFLFHRDLDLPALVDRLVEKGRAGTRAFLADGETDGSRAVSD